MPSKTYIVPLDMRRCIVSLDDGESYFLFVFGPKKRPERACVRLSYIPTLSIISNVAAGQFSYAYVRDDVFWLATRAVADVCKMSVTSAEHCMQPTDRSESIVILNLQAIDIPRFGGYCVALYMETEVFFFFF